MIVRHIIEISEDIPLLLLKNLVKQFFCDIYEFPRNSVFLDIF